MTTRLSAILVITVLISPLPVSGQTPGASVAGTVTDASGAVLPGVSVHVSSAETRTTATVMTDGAGRFAVAGLPAGRYAVSFQLDGFDAGEPAHVRVDPSAGTTVDRVLALAALEETVTVTAKAEPEPPPVPMIPPPPPPKPVPAIVPVAVDTYSVCGPRRLSDTAPVATVVGNFEGPGRLLLGNRDILVLDAGTAAGLTAGQNYVVRRRFLADRTGSAPAARMADHSAGLVQVVEASEQSALARPVYLCDEISTGDRLEPYEPVAVVTQATDAAAEPMTPARVLFADEGRTIGAPADLMVIDRGYADGARPGQRLVVQRRATGGTHLPVGEAVVVAVQARSATIRIESARDAIEAGDIATPLPH